MRIGLVSFINARPLDYSFRRNFHDIIEADPAVLSQRLLAGDLDCALISSVECLRHSNSLGWSKKFGICGQKKIRSVIYIKKKETNRDVAIQKLWADAASRSSVALWKCLYLQLHDALPSIETSPAESIPKRIEKDSAGILIGDKALEFMQSKTAEDYQMYDMAEWWYEKKKLPFVFGLWAYPKHKPIEDSFFQKSLDEGLKNLDKIICASPFANTDSYLKTVISYNLGTKELDGLEQFRLALLSANLL